MAVEWKTPPSKLKREMSHADYIRVMAFYALEDPKQELQKEIEYKQRRDEILRERAERAAGSDDK